MYPPGWKPIKVPLVFCVPIKDTRFIRNSSGGPFWLSTYYNTPMLHFGPYVTFQPRVRHILAHSTSLCGPLYVTFGPCGHAHKMNTPTSCWPAYIGTCNRIMTLLTELPVGENEETYIDGLDANDIQTDTVTQPVWAIAVFRGMILTFIPLWMERYKCDSSLQHFDFWSSWCFELDLS